MCCSSWTAILDKRVRKRKSITTNNKDAESSLPFRSTQWMGKYLSTAVLSFWMLQLSHAGYLIRSGTAASTQTSTPLAVRSPTTVTMVTILTLVFQWRQCVWRMVAGAMLRHRPDVSVSTFIFIIIYFFFSPMIQWRSSVRPKSLTLAPTCSLLVVFFTLYPSLTHWTHHSLFSFMFYIRLWRLFVQLKPREMDEWF